MKIGGLLKFSLIDYPGKVAAVIFTQGCNFRCAYCHNPELVYPELFTAPLSESEVFSFLESRREHLSGVVITGGEPTMQQDLLDVMRRVKKMGFAVKLDTNGSRPDVISWAIDERLVDFIAMDIKAPLYKYEYVTGAHGIEAAVLQSIERIVTSGISHEFRTTISKSILEKDEIPYMTELINGAGHYRLQPCVQKNRVAPVPSSSDFSDADIVALQSSCRIPQERLHVLNA